jgi:hypothetical protein
MVLHLTHLTAMTDGCASGISWVCGHLTGKRTHLTAGTFPQLSQMCQIRIETSLKESAGVSRQARQASHLNHLVLAHRVGCYHVWCDVWWPKLVPAIILIVLYIVLLNQTH